MRVFKRLIARTRANQSWASRFAPAMNRGVERTRTASAADQRTCTLEANLVDAFRESLRDLRQLALLLVRKLSLRKREAQACSVPNDGYVRPSTVGLFRC